MKNDAMIICIDKKKKKAIAFEGSSKKLDMSIYGERHPKYRWKIDNIHISKDDSIIEFSEDDVEKRNKMIVDISKKLKNQVNVEEFLKDKLEDYPLDDIEDLYKRLQNEKAKVTNKEGCFYLNIGGKKGHPKTLTLSD